MWRSMGVVVVWPADFLRYEPTGATFFEGVLPPRPSADGPTAALHVDTGRIFIIAVDAAWS